MSLLRFVDAVVVDLDQDKRLAWRLQPFDVLFKGDDWKDTPKGAQLEAEMAGVRALPALHAVDVVDELRRFIAPEDFTDEASAEKPEQAEGTAASLPVVLEPGSSWANA